MEQDFNADAIPTNGQEAEALLEHFASPSEQMSEGPAETPGSGPPPLTEQQMELNYRGQLEKHPLSKILEFASQGRDYSQKMRDLRIQRELFEKDRTKYADLDERIKRYSEVEEYIKKDPAWWQHVQQSYQQRGNAQTPAQLPPEVMAKIEAAHEFATVEKVRREDESLDSNIRAYKEKYPDFDWGKVDEQGRSSLELAILQHAIDHKIEDFSIAANSYLFDEHVKRAQVAAKEDVGKQIQKQTKLGLGPVTAKPVLQLKRPESVREKSYDELAQEGMQALGIV